MIKKLAALTAAAFAVNASAASAEEIRVKMLNKGSDGEIMVFEPALIRANVGDTIIFVPTDPGHNAESIKGMLPEGAEAFKGNIGQEVSYQIQEEGVYGVKCLPHYGIGMVSLIIAGEPANLEAAKSVREIAGAKKRFENLFDNAMAAGE